MGNYWVDHLQELGYYLDLDKQKNTSAYAMVEPNWAYGTRMKTPVTYLVVQMMRMDQHVVYWMMGIGQAHVVHWKMRIGQAYVVHWKMGNEVMVMVVQPQCWDCRIGVLSDVVHHHHQMVLKVP